MIVDDNAEVAEFIYQILHAKYRCRVAENGKSGLELVMELLPDLIVSDVMMPVMDGLTATKTIRSLKHPDAETIQSLL